MYIQAAQLFRQYFGFILLLSIMLSIAEVVFQLKASTRLFPEFMAYGYTAYFFHLTILTGFEDSLFKKGSKAQTPKFGFWVAYFLPVLVLIVAVVMSLKVFLARYISLLMPELVVYVALLFAVFIFGVFLAVFGTMIPAAVVGRGTGISAAFVRAKSTIFYVFPRLVLGPFLVSVVWFVIASILERIVGNQIGAQSVLGFVLETGSNLLGYFSIALTASILSSAFLRSEKT